MDNTSDTFVHALHHFLLPCLSLFYFVAKVFHERKDLNRTSLLTSLQVQPLEFKLIMMTSLLARPCGWRSIFGEILDRWSEGHTSMVIIGSYMSVKVQDKIVSLSSIIEYSLHMYD